MEEEGVNLRPVKLGMVETRETEASATLEVKRRARFFYRSVRDPDTPFPTRVVTYIACPL